MYIDTTICTVGILTGRGVCIDQVHRQSAQACCLLLAAGAVYQYILDVSPVRRMDMYSLSFWAYGGVSSANQLNQLS